MKKFTKQQIIALTAIVLLIVVAIVTGVYYNQSVTVQNVVQIQKPSLVNSELTYKGKDGITALVLLQENATIVTKGTGEMAYITTINGVTANPKNQYWQLFLNDKSASVGAGSLVTKSTDTITWKLSSF